MSENATTPRGPDFLCIGAKKAGTTWLYDQLLYHPRIWQPPIKELHIFNDTALYTRDIGRLDRRREEIEEMRRTGMFKPADDDFLDTYLGPGAGAIDWYFRLFATAGDRVAGEIDPNVAALYGRMLSRLGQVLPRMKLIFILRHPVMRVWSHISMNAKVGGVDLAAEPEDMIIAAMQQPNLAAFSAYRQNIEELRRHFAPERVLFLSFDELATDPGRLLRRVWDFLDVPHMAIPETAARKSNAGVAMPMPPRLRAAMTAFHQDDLDCALDVLGIDPEQLVM